MTSQLLGDVAVRQATLDDKAAVLAINEDIADGRDYLPALYDYCITSPNAQMFVLLLKDKIVAFSGVLYVDGGLTGVGRAARIRPDLAGQRLAYHLMTNMAKIAKDKGIIRQAGTEVQKGIISRERREMKERVGEVELLYKIILPYTANTEHLQQPTPHVIASKVDVVTDVILTEYFSTEAIHPSAQATKSL